MSLPKIHSLSDFNKFLDNCVNEGSCALTWGGSRTISLLDGTTVYTQDLWNKLEQLLQTPSSTKNYLKGGLCEKKIRQIHELTIDSAPFFLVRLFHFIFRIKEFNAATGDLHIYNMIHNDTEKEVPYCVGKEFGINSFKIAQFLLARKTTTPFTQEEKASFSRILLEANRNLRHTAPIERICNLYSTVLSPFDADFQLAFKKAQKEQFTDTKENIFKHDPEEWAKIFTETIHTPKLDSFQKLALSQALKKLLSNPESRKTAIDLLSQRWFFDERAYDQFAELLLDHEHLFSLSENEITDLFSDSLKATASALWNQYPSAFTLDQAPSPDEEWKKIRLVINTLWKQPNILMKQQALLFLEMTVPPRTKCARGKTWDDLFEQNPDAYKDFDRELIQSSLRLLFRKDTSYSLLQFFTYHPTQADDTNNRCNKLLFLSNRNHIL